MFPLLCFPFWYFLSTITVLVGTQFTFSNINTLISAIDISLSLWSRIILPLIFGIFLEDIFSAVLFTFLINVKT